MIRDVMREHLTAEPLAKHLTPEPYPPPTPSSSPPDASRARKEEEEHLG